MIFDYRLFPPIPTKRALKKSMLPDVLRTKSFFAGFHALALLYSTLVESLIARGIIRPRGCNELMETVRKDRST